MGSWHLNSWEQIQLLGFWDDINSHMIPAKLLMKEIHPLGIVPYHIIFKGLAYQANLTSVEPIKHTSERGIFKFWISSFPIGIVIGMKLIIVFRKGDLTNPFLSMFIHFHSFSSIFIHFHPFSSIFIHFYPFWFFQVHANRKYSRGGRSMSVQSSLDPYGSNLTLSSTNSSASAGLTPDVMSTQDGPSPSRCSSVSRYSN